MIVSNGNKRLTGMCAYAIVMLFCAATVLAGELEPGVAALSREETLRLGERIYREGVLPSGAPLKAFVQGDIPVEGTMFSCESCHMRAGLGSNEGRVVTLPTNGRKLYQPMFTGRQFTSAEQKAFSRNSTPLYQAPPRRPAYTDETLAAVLRGGVDPAGRQLDYVMPRYDLEDRDMAILVYYLKALSTEPSPGVTATTIRFATVITEEVSPEDRAAMLVPLEAYVRDRNNQAPAFETRAKYRVNVEEMDLAYRRLSLARWELKGPPETWRGQLEEYYRKEPVFALIGGITYGDWRPIHEFSEEHRIPCIFPITDFPVISETDWYTLYFSKGLYQEGEGAARFLSRKIEPAPDAAIVQVAQDTPEGRALAAGFQETWQGLGLQPPVTRMLPAGETASPSFLRQLIDKEKPAALLLWLGPESLPALDAIAADPNRTGLVMVSSGLLKQELAKLPDPARVFTYITYPYRLPQEEGPYADLAKTWLKSRKAPVNDRRISTRTYSLFMLLTTSFMHMRGNHYRDNFLDVISMYQDLYYPDYERLSFGPGQRYASKGCYIVQLTRGASPSLVRKSDWVIH